jgi:hypothetical protein
MSADPDPGIARARRLREIWRRNRDGLLPYLHRTRHANAFDRLPSDPLDNDVTANVPIVRFQIRFGTLNDEVKPSVRIYVIEAEGIIVEGPIPL